MPSRSLISRRIASNSRHRCFIESEAALVWGFVVSELGARPTRVDAKMRCVVSDNSRPDAVGRLAGRLRSPSDTRGRGHSTGDKNRPHRSTWRVGGDVDRKSIVETGIQGVVYRPNCSGWHEIQI